MSPGIWFWIIYVVIGFFGGYLGYTWPGDRRPFFSDLVLFILVGLLGWGVFGPPIH